MKDPQQWAATEILNQQGRTKAQFIASAVLHYVNCPETSDLPAGPVLMNNDELEQRVLMLVKKFFTYMTPEADTEFVEAENQPPQGAAKAFDIKIPRRRSRGYFIYRQSPLFLAYASNA